MQVSELQTTAGSPSLWFQQQNAFISSLGSKKGSYRKAFPLPPPVSVAECWVLSPNGHLLRDYFHWWGCHLWLLYVVKCRLKIYGLYLGFSSNSTGNTLCCVCMDMLFPMPRFCDVCYLLFTIQTKLILEGSLGVPIHMDCSKRVHKYENR